MSIAPARTPQTDNPSDIDVSVVVPVFRGSRSIEALRERLQTALANAGMRYELIFVEDCGGDDSWQVLESMCAQHNEVRAIKLSRNFGQHAATLCGIARTRGRWVATIDDDLEQPPEALPDLVRKAEQGFTVVYGINEVRSHAAWRNFTSGVGRALFKFAIPNLNREYSSMRVIDGSIARQLERFQSPFTFVDGYLSWLTHNYATVVVPHHERPHGRSNYNLRRLVAHMVNIFLTFSDLPLRAATWLGVVTAFGGGLWGLTILIGRTTGAITTSGYASMMAGITFLGGMQLLILGVFGQYLGRINFKTASMPVFLAERELGS
jgi:undecaprenyl-phosphate 4-deoxy-4-formamido-L-arabinose transferase